MLIPEILAIERPSPQVQDAPTLIKHENCEKCDASHKDLVYFKSIINHLQKQLRLIEESQSNNKSTNEEVCLTPFYLI
jgi:hypothetical protein